MWYAKNEKGIIYAEFDNVYECSNFCQDYNKKNDLEFSLYDFYYDKEKFNNTKLNHLWPYNEEGRKANGFDF